MHPQLLLKTLNIPTLHPLPLHQNHQNTCNNFPPSNQLLSKFSPKIFRSLRSHHPGSRATATAAARDGKLWPADGIYSRASKDRLPGFVGGQARERASRLLLQSCPPRGQGGLSLRTVGTDPGCHHQRAASAATRTCLRRGDGLGCSGALVLDAPVLDAPRRRRPFFLFFSFPFSHKTKKTATSPAAAAPAPAPAPFTYIKTARSAGWPPRSARAPGRASCLARCRRSCSRRRAPTCRR